MTRRPAIIRRVYAVCAGLTAVVAMAEPSGAAVPDLSGLWGRNSFAYEVPASGPAPVENATRLPNGQRDRTTLAGDYTNPILKPEAAKVVERFGAVSRSGKGFPDANNQCWPEGPPFIYRVLETQIIQRADEVAILYAFDHQVRRIRMNSSHPVNVTPSWYGDSVGHFEGDTLVVDTIGIRVGPFSMVDRFGTPYSDRLHLVERFSLIDRSAAIAVMARNERENGRIPPEGGGGRADPNDPGKALQIAFTVEDPKIFTMPWSATITYRRNVEPWQELVCAENLNNHGVADEPRVPVADSLDF